MRGAVQDPDSGADQAHKMREPRRALILVAVLAAALLAAPAAQAWVRKESDRWVWYVPTSKWVDAQSDNGIDISSPTGVLYVGHGFAQSPVPVTHAWVVGYVKRSHGLDLHPLRRVKVGRGSRTAVRGEIARRVYRWTGYRTDRRERVRGVLTVDVISNDAAASYGFALYNRVAPLSMYRAWSGRLAFIQRHILLHPRTPDFNF
jgi:opacity protein-like surface antigen